MVSLLHFIFVVKFYPHLAYMLPLDIATTLDKLIGLFKYNMEQPLLFSSGLFLFLFAAFAGFYQLLQNRLRARIVYVTLFSLAFYYKSSGMYFLILLFLSASDFAISHLMYSMSDKLKRKMLVILSLVINLGILCYFKYTNLLIDLFNNLHSGDPLAMSNIFLPVGVSFFTFQSMSYVIDIYRKRIKPVDRWIDYLFYLSFFPQLVAGPIVRARDFIPQIYHNPVFVTRRMFTKGFLLIISGLFKKAVISDYISLNFVDRVFDNPTLYSGAENLLGLYGYTLQIYCDFSGYTDMAIGIALLLGFHFNDNFNSPYKSATITEFWRRWHISLSSWLKDYLYISLGGNRKGRLRTYLNLIITMLLGGLWHGAAVRFIIWGAIHGLSLAVHKWFMERFGSFKTMGHQMSRPRRLLGIVITFHLVAFAWIFFRAADMNIARAMIYKIFTDLSLSNIPTIVSGYKGVFLLMAIGYVLHFLPASWERAYYKRASRLPIAVIGLALVAAIWLVMQVKSSEIAPFIYFQF